MVIKSGFTDYKKAGQNDTIVEKTSAVNERVAQQLFRLYRVVILRCIYSCKFAIYNNAFVSPYINYIDRFGNSKE